MTGRGLPFELFIGLRYLRSKGRRGFVSLLTVIAMAGMALGVMALILVLGVMSGAEEEFMGKILGATAHVMVLDVAGKGIEDVERVVALVRRHPEVRVASPFVLQQAMLSTDQGATGVVIRGMDPAVGQAELRVRVRQGSLAALAGPEPGIALGRELARTLGASVGQTVTAVSPRGAVTAVGTIQWRSSRSGSTSTTRLWPTRRWPPPSSSPTWETASRASRCGSPMPTGRAGSRWTSARPSGSRSGHGTGWT
ncbi:MAG: ABC transporter permease [Candidatus Rokubacteria bacterium]|nr:ABC transporter permease [Candidatus Rokubacteria bacterium]